MRFISLVEHGKSASRCYETFLPRSEERRVVHTQTVRVAYISARQRNLNSKYRHPQSAADAYALGLLIHFAFNRTDALPTTALPPHPLPPASSRGSIPVSVFPSFKRLLNPNPKARMTPKHFLEIGMAETAGEGSGFFADNRLVKVCAGLDHFSIASEVEKNNLLKYGFPLDKRLWSDTRAAGY